MAIKDRGPTWITPERASAIWEAKGPFGNFSDCLTVEEDREIARVWKTLPGHFSWADTLLSIVRGRHPVKEVK